MSQSLFVIIPGFGCPQWDLKLGILYNNIGVIESYPWIKWKMIICQYEMERNLPDDILNHPCIQVIKEEGIVGEYIYRYARPEELAEDGFTHAMIVLDDVELIKKTFDWHSALSYIDVFKADILSPSMSEDSAIQYAYMVTRPKAMYSLKFTPCCELFCYIMPMTSFAQYYNRALDIDNPWMWGVDLVLKLKHNLQPIILNRICMRHFIKGESYQQHPDKNPLEGQNKYFIKHGVNTHQVSDQPSEMFYVIPV